MDNRSLSHTRWKCQYHIVFIPKYRKKVLYGKVREDVREILSILCKYKNVEIIAGAVCIDHVHLSVAIPPKMSIANFMGYLKGKSTLMIYDRHPEMQSKWDSVSGDINDYPPISTPDYIIARLRLYHERQYEQSGNYALNEIRGELFPAIRNSEINVLYKDDNKKDVSLVKFVVVKLFCNTYG